MITAVLASAAALVWVVLVFFRGWFWLARERDDAPLPREEPSRWPAVTAVIPARDEAECVGATISTLLEQDYPGDFRIVLIDDQSTDGTADAARMAAAGRKARLTILAGGDRPPGWTGKLWAVAQGVRAVEARPDAPPLLLLTDADIAWDQGALRALVRRALAGRYVLTSLMVRLHCRSRAEVWLIPAFVYFFQMLYPFALVARPGSRVAAAAGGCMLVRRDALAAAGGIESIRGALIDDCALGAAMKRQGPVWLGLGTRVRSLRAYPDLSGIRQMVVRSAYAQLRYSPLLLAGCIAGLALTFWVAPLVAVLGAGWPAITGLVVWLAMALTMAPMLMFYGLSPLRGLALPVIATFYLFFTVESAVQHWRGRGGMWKGRAQAMTPHA